MCCESWVNFLFESNLFHCKWDTLFFVEFSIFCLICSSEKPFVSPFCSEPLQECVVRAFEGLRMPLDGVSFSESKYNDVCLHFGRLLMALRFYSWSNLDFTIELSELCFECFR